MGGHKDIRRHTRTLREDKAMCWGKARTWWGWNSVGGGPLCRGGPRGLQGVFRGAPGWIWVVPGVLNGCLHISGWIWGIRRVVRDLRGDPGVDLGASNGGWRVLGRVGFPVTLGCTRVGLGGLEGI